MPRKPWEQFNLFGGSEPVAAPVEPPESKAPLLPAEEIDPRQWNLFDGPVGEVIAFEDACERLEVHAARQAWGRAQERFPQWAAAQRWAEWIADLQWLVAMTNVEHIDELLALHQGSHRRFAGLRPALVESMVREALVQTARRCINDAGPAARLPDGRAVGYLLLIAGRIGEAVSLLATQTDGQGLGYFGEALWRDGRKTEALAAYRDAYLLDPQRVDEVLSTCAPLQDLIDLAVDLELPGNASDWVPVLADLAGVVSLLGTRVPLPVESPAGLLQSLRQKQLGKSSEPERLALKRALLQKAPGLKELVRRI